MIAADMRRVGGLTWVGWLNYLVLRWLFARLFYVVEDDGTRGSFGMLRWVYPTPWGPIRYVGGVRR